MSYMREQVKEWESTSNVTIPLEYFDHLREREEILRELLREIERCFHYDGEKERTIVNIKRLVKHTLKHTDGYFHGNMKEEYLVYDHVSEDKVENGALEEYKWRKAQRDAERQEWSENQPY